MEENMIDETTEQTMEIEENPGMGIDYVDDEGSSVGALAGAVAVGTLIGFAIHKWVAPAVGAGLDMAREAIVKALTKDEEHYEVEKIESDDKKDSDEK